MHARIEWDERTEGMTQAEINELIRSEGRETIPGGYGPGGHSYEEILDHIEFVYEKIYKSQGRDKPSIHTLSHKASLGAQRFMKELSDEFKGKFRELEFDE